MKQKKRLIYALAGLLMVAAIVLPLLRRDRASHPLEGNLLVNGDFARVQGDQPEGWQQGMWVTSPGASYLEAVQIDGAQALLVENAAPNDARFEQRVSVRPGTHLMLTAEVRAEGCGDTLGANLSFMGVYGTSADLRDTGGRWERLTLYAHTAKDMREVTVGLRLGGYGQENTGRAWFKNASLTEVESVPVGAAFVELSTPEPEVQRARDEAPDLAIPLLLGAAAAYLALAAFLLLRVPRSRWGGWTLIGLSLALRLLLAAKVRGYGVDIGCFTAWAARMAQTGPAGFYAADYFCDYPPAYMLVLGLLGLIAQGLNLSLSGMGMQVLLKLVPIACDMVLAGLIYRAHRREAGEKLAGIASILLALNPALLITGACWGQIDALTALLLALVLLEAFRGSWHRAIPLFALAVLTKPQAGLLAPLGLFALGKDLLAGRKEKDGAARRTLIGLALGLGLSAAIVLPFSLRQGGVGWLVRRYADTLGSYAYATLSTGNLLFLLGGNWKPIGEAVLPGVTYAQLGTALMVCAFGLGLAVHARARGREGLLMAAAITLQGIFCLGVKMHERYIVPALVLLLFCALRSGDWRLYASYALASAASAANIGAVLAYEHLVAPHLWLGMLVALVQLAAFALTLYAAVDLVFRRRPPQPLPRWTQKRRAEEAPQDLSLSALLACAPERLPVSRGGVAALLALTALYAAVAFYDLGARVAPQSGYVSTAEGEQVVLDLGERRENFHLYYYGGISDTQFDVSTSDDGVTFSEPIRAYFARGECFKWLALRRPTLDEDGMATGASGAMHPLSGRYLSLRFSGAGASLWEVAAVDEDGKPYPLTVHAVGGAREGRGDDPLCLIDEQETVPVKPTYHNSMYFDEIYHARTGYEHAHALTTYETTHPPLGKDLMALCIHLLGMTPFAWRLAGTIAGILMLPAIWLLALQILRKERWAFFAALLLACDCMHFTQTRIATIDSFPVLFMMAMFFFMARWRAGSILGETRAYRRGLLCLLASGVFMGMAIASKWIGCYGAIGLALLFFERFWRDARLALLCRARSAEDAAYDAAAKTFLRRAPGLILWCICCFAILPVLLYMASYIPYLRHFGPLRLDGATLRRIWDAQTLMFDYHKNLVATHYFASPWYSWPVIGKPMWYYAADYAAPGMASSILAFGNPAVWWTGLAAILYALGGFARRLARPVLSPEREGMDGQALTLIAVGFLSAYLPWVLVSRLTFIYHYFASVPFIILATVYALARLERLRPKLARRIALVLGLLALGLFIGFYPLASGREVARAWPDAMAFFPNWMWY